MSRHVLCGHASLPRFRRALCVPGAPTQVNQLLEIYRQGGAVALENFRLPMLPWGVVQQYGLLLPAGVATNSAPAGIEDPVQEAKAALPAAPSQSAPPHAFLDLEALD